MTYALASLALWALLQWTNPETLSPDGQYYLMQKDRPRPYGGRWLLPLLLGQRVRLWRYVGGGATLGTALLLGSAGPLWLGLASTRTNTRLPVLTDQVGILCVALAVVTGDWRWALLGGAVNEKAPVFIAALLLQPLALLGLLVWFPAFYLSRKADAGDPDWLFEPFKTARGKIEESLNPQMLLFPWGGAVVGLLGVPILAVALAYGQLVLALDRARLYQWIGPAVCLAAVRLVPADFYLALLLVTWANPYRRVL